MIAIETMLGVSIVVLFSAIIARRRTSEKKGDDESTSGDVDEVGANACSGNDWCEAIENAFGIATLCLDDSMRLVSLGPCAERLARGTSVKRDARPHLFDIAPESASRSMIEGVALARRGISSSRRVAWLRTEVGASFAPLAHGGVMVLIREMEEV